MLPLDVPFIPHGEYPDFLAERVHGLCSVHFSLHDPALADARQRMEAVDRKTIVSALSLLGSTSKYVLMNSRLHRPEKYKSAKDLDSTADPLEHLIDEVELRGLVFADPYYLQALSDHRPGLARSLEAVPSVNAGLDSAQRAMAMLDMIEATHFRQPTRLVLDRSLNRDLARLEATVTRLRAARPDVKLHLIANEGCLYHCPYKPAHDAHVALVNEGVCGERTFAMNRDLGCIRRLLDDPGAFLASPFIRPEDMARYEGVVDGIKLCGRTKGAPFLKRAVDAYLSGRYAGNLLDLMDAMGDLADQVVVPNDALPADFLDRVATCAKDCRSCSWCAKLAGKKIKRIDPGLPAL